MDTVNKLAKLATGVMAVASVVKGVTDFINNVKGEEN